MVKINKVKDALRSLIRTFKEKPTLFYTENDVVCYAYKLIQDKLHWPKPQDIEGNLHFLVHTEYPTPFKCSMKNNKFTRKEDNSAYKRGHFDLVILERDFISKNPYSLIKAQDFKKFLKWKKKSDNKKYISCAVEFMLNRDPIKPSRDKLKATRNFCKKVNQDAKKLNQVKKEGFCDQIYMLVLDNATTDKAVLKSISNTLSGMVKYINNPRKEYVENNPK